MSTEDTALVARPEAPELTPYEVIERVITSGDLSRMDPQGRVAFYWRTCESLGLNPLTRPFEYIVLDGKMTLYARKDATDQLRSINRVSVTQLRSELNDSLGLLTVFARGRTPDGREEESSGVVSVKGFQGQALANLFMKAETKAKRRLTLSLVGLGFLDESEVEGGSTVVVDHATGVIADSAPSSLLAAVQAQAQVYAEPAETPSTPVIVVEAVQADQPVPSNPVEPVDPRRAGSSGSRRVKEPVEPPATPSNPLNVINEHHAVPVNAVDPVDAVQADQPAVEAVQEPQVVLQGVTIITAEGSTTGDMLTDDSVRPHAPLTLVEFSERMTATGVDREVVRAKAKAMFPELTRFGEATPEQLGQLWGAVAPAPAAVTPEEPEELFTAPMTVEESAEVTLPVCGAVSPFSGATCKSWPDHSGAHRASDSEAW